MALIYRTSQKASYVHRTDPSCNPDGPAGPDSQWIQAEGQPEDATRFVIRPLSKDEWRGITSLKGEDAGSLQVLKAAEIGLVSVGGEAPPDDLSRGIAQEVGTLVIALTLDPTSGRHSKLAAE